jgi:hypothetical protein
MSPFQLVSRRVFLSPFRRSNVVDNVGRRSMMAFEDQARLRVRMHILIDCKTNDDH